MKRFETPRIEQINFSLTDIICASGGPGCPTDASIDPTGNTNPIVTPEDTDRD